MADDLLSYEIFWTRDEVENDVANDQHRTKSRKPLTSMQAQPEAKTHRRLHDEDKHQKPEKDMPPQINKQKKSRHLEKSPKVKEKPSLKDLRPEDKKRVANLIRELAKAGEEKEVALEQLQVERLEFGDRMKGLHHQMDDITQEREIVQKQYLECQKLMSDYQIKLAEEQEKVSRMDQLAKTTPKHRTKHPSPLHSGRDPSRHQRNSPGFHQTSLHQHTAHQHTHHHQPSLNGYPPPSTQNIPQPTPNGYQPLQFYNQVPGGPQHQNSVPHEIHHRNDIFPGVGEFDVNSQNGHVDFEPPLSSTHRPSHNHHVKSGHRGQMGMVNDVPGNLAMPYPMPSRSSPDFLLSGHSRTASGEFQPLLPDPDLDSESSSPTTHLDSYDFKPLQADPKSNRTRPRANHNSQVNQRQQELFKQRVLLEQEHAWLRQKLSEQEQLLVLKQAQLTETELLYLKTGPQSNSDPYSYPHLHKHRSHDINPPPIQRQPYGVLPPAKGTHISTNFPPDKFDDFGQSKLLTGSMYELRQGYRSGHLSHGSGDCSSASSVSGTPRHKGRRRSHDARRHPHRRMSFDERAPSKGDAYESPGHCHSDGYVSFHSASKSKRKHGGSVSSSPSTASTSTKSSNRRHRKLKNTSTSPLYRDVSAGTSPLALSPGRVQMTKAPLAQDSFNRSSSHLPHHNPSRLQGNLSLQNNRSRTSPSRPMVTSNRDTLQLTDLIDSLDAAAISRTPDKSMNRSYNSPPERLMRSTHGVTPELFSLQEGSDTEMDQQESRILEDVFFVL